MGICIFYPLETTQLTRMAVYVIWKFIGKAQFKQQNIYWPMFRWSWHHRSLSWMESWRIVSEGRGRYRTLKWLNYLLTTPIPIICLAGYCCPLRRVKGKFVTLPGSISTITRIDERIGDFIRLRCFDNEEMEEEEMEDEELKAVLAAYKRILPGRTLRDEYI